MAGGAGWDDREIVAALGVPLFEIADLTSDKVVHEIANRSPDVIATSCFPWKVRETVRNVAHLGAINLHPSLLPLFRGPDPLFWQFRAGVSQGGMTIHALTDALDAGPILAQRSLIIEDGMSGAELERRLGMIGGMLLAQTIDSLMLGGARPVAQDEARASYQSWPGAADLEIPTHWTARRAFNFIRGVSPLGYRPIVMLNGKRLEVVGAELVEKAAIDKRPVSAGVPVRFADDWLVLKIAPRRRV
jgi:methionyl-tRNA formyltransferase